MRSWRHAVSAGIALAALTLAVSAQPASAGAGGGEDGSAARDGRFSFAVIGDVPYGDAQIANFPHVIDQINA